MSSWTQALLTIALVAHGILLAGTVLQLLTSKVRLWPPPGRNSWQFGLVWGLFVPGAVATIGLGVLDWNSLGWPAALHLPFGGLLTVGGLGLAFTAIAGLSVEQTLGLEGDLRVDGPYRWSRNPQYLGDIVATVGWAILTASVLAALVAAMAVVWYLLLPRLEEPWLEARFGDAYRRYREGVPRFIGLPIRTGPPKKQERRE